MSKEKLIKHQKEMLEVEENEIDEDFRCAASTPPPPEQFDDKDEEVFKQHQIEMLGEDEPQPPPNISYGEADEDFRCTSVTPLQSPFFGCKNKNIESFEDGKNDAFGDFRCAASTPPRAEEEEELVDNNENVFKQHQLEMLGEDEPEPPPNISYGDEDDEDDDEHYSSTHSTPPLTFITNISDAGHGLDQLVQCLPQTLLAKIAPASAAIFVGENEAEEQEEAENKMVGQPKKGIQEAQTVQPSSSQSPAKSTKAKVRSYDREAFMKVRKSRTADEWNAYLWTNHAESWEIDSHPFELDPELRVPFWKQIRVVRQREEERRRWSEVGKQPYPYHMKQHQYRSQQQASEQKGKKGKMKKEKQAGTTFNPVGYGNERGGQQADGAMVVEFGRRAIERSKQFTAKKRAEKQAKREALLAKAAEKDWTESELDEEEDEGDDDIDEEGGEEQSKGGGKEEKKEQQQKMKKKGADDGVLTPKANGNGDTAGGKQRQQSQEQHYGGDGTSFPFCAHGPPFSFAEMAVQANWIAAQPQFQAYMAELTAAMSQMHLDESSEQ